jgi:glycosyltransferase involved in cell wall biosynthesis
VRVAFDATALLGARTGVGVFTHEVLDRLTGRDDLAVVAYGVTWRGRNALAAASPSGIRVARRPMPARPLRAAWSRFDRPPIEWFTGSVDLVHGPNFVVPPSRSAAELVTVHDLTCVRFPELCTADTLEYPGLIRRALARGATIHVVSTFVGDEVRDAFGVEADRVLVIPNGVTPLVAIGPNTDAAAGARWAGSDRYVLALGTVEPRKDLPTLVRAFDRLADDDPELRLVIAGPNGWGADALAAVLAASSHRDRVTRLGWVDDEQRAALVRGAAVFAYPSRYEGFGLPPLEAMSAGTPVVATTAGALPEVLGDAAELVPVDDPDALAVAIDSVLGDTGRAEGLRQAGRERAAGFGWDATVESLVEVYAQLAGNPSSPPG